MAKEVLTFENLIKYAVLLCTLTGFYYKQSSDIRDLGTEKKFQIEYLQYQITELKNCCGKNGTERRLSYNNRSAIIPNSIELQDEN
jgi:hypothetical protein